MATQAQRDAFLATYGPQAKTAGNTLGIDPNLIYAQWANESGYGTNSQSQGFNVAGIMPGGRAATYTSPDDFESSYVSVIQKNDPAALNTGSDASAFVSGLQKGNYFGTDSPSAYLSNVSSIASGNPLGAWTGSAANDAASMASVGAAPTPTGTPSGPAAASSGLIDRVWEYVSRGGLLLLGGIAVLIGIVALIWQSKTVQVSTSHLAEAAAV